MLLRTLNYFHLSIPGRHSKRRNFYQVWKKNGLLMPFARFFLHLALQLEALIGLEPPSLGATSSQPTGAISLNRCRWRLELLHHVEGFDGLFFFIWRRWRWSWDVKLMLDSKWSRDGWDDDQLHLNRLFLSDLGANFCVNLDIANSGTCQIREVELRGQVFSQQCPMQAHVFVHG